MKKNLAFLMVCLLTVSAGRSLATDMTETNSTPETAAPRNTCLHSFVITPTPGGASITITGGTTVGIPTDESCYPIEYTYEVWAYGLVHKTGEGSTSGPGFGIETTYMSNYQLHLHGVCRNGARFFQIFEVGDYTSDCGKEFTNITLIRQSNGVIIDYLTQSPAHPLMNPSEYAIYKNGIKMSGGNISNNRTFIPFGDVTGDFEVRIYGDKCACPNKVNHYYSETFTR